MKKILILLAIISVYIFTGCDKKKDGANTIFGCTDSMSLNFNPFATVNDGSCTYMGGIYKMHDSCNDTNYIATVDTFPSGIKNIGNLFSETIPITRNGYQLTLPVINLLIDNNGYHDRFLGGTGNVSSDGSIITISYSYAVMINGTQISLNKCSATGVR